MYDEKSSFLAGSDLTNRLFVFAIRCLKFTKNLSNTPEYKIIRYQLVKSSTSAGANYEESQAGSSRADFNNKVRIALREMRESNYWLRIISAMNEHENNTDLQWLLKESDELKRILGSITQKSRIK